VLMAVEEHAGNWRLHDNPSIEELNTMTVDDFKFLENLTGSDNSVLGGPS